MGSLRTFGVGEFLRQYPKVSAQANIKYRTCSPAAQEIQDQVPNVDFDQYCTIQVSWHSP